MGFFTCKFCGGGGNELSAVQFEAKVVVEVEDKDEPEDGVEAGINFLGGSGGATGIGLTPRLDLKVGLAKEY